MPTVKRSQHEENSGTYHYARGLSGGAIAGIAIGVILVAIAIGGFFWVRRRRNRQRQSQFLDSPVNSHPIYLIESVHDTRNASAAPAPIQTGAEEEEAREQKAGSDTTVNAFDAKSPEAQVDTTEYKYQAYRPTTPPELGGDERHEVSGAPPAYELHAANVNRGPHYPSTCIPMSRANTSAANP